MGGRVLRAPGGLSPGTWATTALAGDEPGTPFGVDVQGRPALEDRRAHRSHRPPRTGRQGLRRTPGHDALPVQRGAATFTPRSPHGVPGCWSGVSLSALDGEGHEGLGEPAGLEVVPAELAVTSPRVPVDVLAALVQGGVRGRPRRTTGTAGAPVRRVANLPASTAAAHRAPGPAKWRPRCTGWLASNVEPGAIAARTEALVDESNRWCPVPGPPARWDKNPETPFTLVPPTSRPRSSGHV